MTPLPELTACMQVVTPRRVETCIGCRGRLCDCCGGTGRHVPPNYQKQAERVNHQFVDDRKASGMFKPVAR